MFIEPKVKRIMKAISELEDDRRYMRSIKIKSEVHAASVNQIVDYFIIRNILKEKKTQYRRYISFTKKGQKLYAQMQKIDTILEKKQ